MINKILQLNISKELNFEDESKKIDKLIDTNKDISDIVLADSVQLILYISLKELISIDTCINIVKQIKNIK